MLNVESLKRISEREKNLFSFRPTTKEDKPKYLKWFADPRVRKKLLPSTPQTDEEIDAWLDTMVGESDSRYFIINEGDTAIGSAGVKHIDESARKAEISFVIGESDRIGTGVGFTAVYNFIGFVFSEFQDVDSVYILRRKSLGENKFFSSTGFLHMTGTP